MTLLLLPTNACVRKYRIWYPMQNNIGTPISLSAYLTRNVIYLPSQLCAWIAPTPSKIGLGRPCSALARSPHPPPHPHPPTHQPTPTPWASYSAKRTLIIYPNPDPCAHPSGRGVFCPFERLATHWGCVISVCTRSMLLAASLLN